MKKRFLLLVVLSCCLMTANAADLLDVFQQAIVSDPVYQQAISQRLATKEGVPISLAAILPTMNLKVNPAATRSAFSGANVRSGFFPRNNTSRTYTLSLVATQTVFNFAQFSAVAGAFSTSKGADATLNAALQDLMIRTSDAYFAVLQDEDNLNYSEASKLAFAEQLDQVRQQFNVGLKTVTDVYTAQASYDSAVANYIAAQTKLANDRENLRVITGVYYPKVSSLSDEFPLITPRPTDIEEWVRKAQEHNWAIKASQYTVETASHTIKQQFGGHLPTVSLQGTLDRIYTRSINGSIVSGSGPSTQTDRQIMVNVTVPILAGGLVIAETNQAIYNYKVAQQQLEQMVRKTINLTRQSYHGVIAGISQITADKQAIKSNISSLEGMVESYKVGVETLVNVLNQQQKLYQAQTQYATDRYAFVNNVLALKQAAGTLSLTDLRAINAWLIEKDRTSVGQRSAYKQHRKKAHHAK